MPMYDYQCQHCGGWDMDVFEPVVVPERLCLYESISPFWNDPPCPGVMRRAWLAKAPSVSGDACDVTIRHGLCNSDGTPRRYTSKAEIQREADKRGLVSRVRHVGTKSGDRSKHTIRWI